MSISYLRKLSSSRYEDEVIAPEVPVNDTEVDAVPVVDDAAADAQDVEDTQEIIEAVTEANDLQDTATTLRAIVDTIKKEGTVSRQLYSFLQATGYIEAAQTYHNSNYNSISFPGVESVTTLNKSYTNSLIYAYEGMIAAAEEAIQNRYDGVLGKFKALLLKWASAWLTTKRKVEVLHDTLASMSAKGDLRDTIYSGGLPSFRDMQTLAGYAKDYVKALTDCEAKYKYLISGVERGDQGILDTVGNNLQVYKDTIVKLGENIDNLFNYSISNKTGSIADAGFTYNNLSNEAYKLALTTYEFSAAKVHDFLISTIKCKDTLANMVQHPICTIALKLLGVYPIYFFVKMIGYLRKVKFIARGYVAACTEAIKASKRAARA